MLSSLFRNTMLISAIAASLLPFVASKAEAADAFGAISYSPSTHVYESAVTWSRAAAEREALYNCQKNSGAGDCRTLIWFENAWGALAVGSNGTYGTGWGYDHKNVENGRYIAGRYAVQTCRKYGGVNCRVVFARPAIAQTIDNGTNLNPVHE